MPSGHLVLHQNQNQAAWAVKFHPVLRGTKLSERCVLPKDAPHPSGSLQSRQSSCTEWGLSSGSMWWHQLLKQKPRSPVRPSGKAAEGAGGRPGNIKDFSCMNFSSVKKPAHSVTGSSQLWHLHVWKQWGDLSPTQQATSCEGLFAPVTTWATAKGFLSQGQLSC